MAGASKGRKRKTRASSNSESSQDSQVQVCKPEGHKIIPRFGSNKRAKLVLRKNGGNIDNPYQDIPLTQPTPNITAYNEDDSQTQGIICSTQIPLPLTQPAHVHHSNTEMSICDDIERQCELVPDKCIPATQPIHPATEETNIVIPATQPPCATDKKINVPHVSVEQLGCCTVERIPEMTHEIPADEHVLSPIQAQNTNKELWTTEEKRICNSTSENEPTPQREETIPGFTLSQVASQLNTAKPINTDTEKLGEQKNHDRLGQKETLESTGNKSADVEKETGEAEAVAAHVPIEAVVEVDSRNLSLLNPFNDDNEFEEAEGDSLHCYDDNKPDVEDKMSGHSDTQNELPLGISNEDFQHPHVATIHDPNENASLPSTQISPAVPHERAHGTSPPAMKQTSHNQLEQPSQEEIKAVQEMMDLTAADLLESQLAIGGISPPPPMRSLERDRDWDTLEGSKMLRGLIEELSTMNQFLVRCKRQLECARHQRNAWIKKTQGQHKV